MRLSDRCCLCVFVLLLLPGCQVTDDRVYGGGEVVVEVASEDTGIPTQTWQIPGLDDDLTTRGRTIGDDDEPDCGEGPGAWLWEDNGYPIELWACGDDMWFILDFGRDVEKGHTVNGQASGTSLELHWIPEGDGKHSLGDSAYASVRVSQKAVSGSFEDDQAKVLGAEPAAVTIDWAMDPDIWVLKHR